MTTKTKKPAGEITHTFTNRELNDAKEVLDYLAKERSYADTMTKVRVSRLQLEFRRLFEPIRLAIQDLIEEHGEGEEGEKIIKPGTAAMRRYQKAVSDLLEKGENVATFVPLEYESLLVKRRNSDGEREDEIVELSPEEIGKLGPLLVVRES